MRGAVAIAAMVIGGAMAMWLAACGATEGPLLRAPGQAGAGAQQDGGASGAAGGGAGAAGSGTGTAGGGAGASVVETPLVVGMTFQYQLQDTIDTDVDAELFVIDLFNASTSVIDELHEQGRVVACYVSAGTNEPWRDDTDRFPDSAVGEPLADYPSESWLDVRDPQVRAIMAERIALAADKGFDAVLPTSLTAYTQDSGFPLTAADQLDYTLWLASQIRGRGMSPGMSGDYAQSNALVASFDWAVHFRCIERGRCGELAPFVEQGKPRFDLEYEGELATICPEAERQQVVAILKDIGLDASREACP